MALWFAASLIEILLALSFGAVLFYLRACLTGRTIAFWVLLWAARGATALLCLRYLPAGDLRGMLYYVALEICFAAALMAIAFRLETQKQQVLHLQGELERFRKEAVGKLDLDPLTGLLNSSALAAWVEQERAFQGLIVVCDLDDFKLLNDIYGHLVGDEILRGIGQLIRNSIRPEDRAFRWGGDEFVIFFENPDAEVVEARMHELEQRLQSFHIRNHGPRAVRFSWGTAGTHGRMLRDSLEEADRRMYEFKRARHGQTDWPAPPLARRKGEPG